MDAFKAPVDIYNRAAQHMHLPRIAAPGDMSQVAQELNFAYDKIRQAELRRNLWRFATRRQQVRPLDYTTMIIKPLLWQAPTAYPAGAIVSYPLGNYWISRLPNTNQVPSNTTVDSYGELVWDSYFGPLTAQSWNHQVPGQPEPSQGSGGSAAYDTPGSENYQAGELAFVPIGNGTAVLFQCLQGTNIGPLEAEGYVDNHYYNKGQIVSWPSSATFILGPNGDTLSDASGLGNVLYQSTSDINIGNDPQLTQLGPGSGGAPPWDGVTSFVVSDYAYGTDNQIYLCVAPSTGNYPDGVDEQGNVVTPGSNPVTDYANAFWQPQYMYMGMWQPLATNPGALSIHWQQIQANLVPITLAWPRGSRGWPVGTGPASEETSSNIYRLPANWMRRAAEDPKSDLAPYLGGPSFINYKDWVFEGDWMISHLTGPVLFRFVADVQDVTAFDPMFAEALALALAIECASACGSKRPLNEIVSLYKNVIEDARTVDAIEQGMTTEPDDLLIAVRF
jgi:hypothetical protein